MTADNTPSAEDIKKERDFWQKKYEGATKEIDDLKARIRTYEISTLPKELTDKINELDSPRDRALGVLDCLPPEVESASAYYERAYAEHHAKRQKKGFR
jgi:hypothetical protein